MMIEIKKNGLLKYKDFACKCSLGKSGIKSKKIELSSIIIENAFDYLDAPVKRISSKDVPMPYALNLENQCLPSVNDIINGIKEVCYI